MTVSAVARPPVQPVPQAPGKDVVLAVLAARPAVHQATSAAASMVQSFDAYL